MDRRQNTKESVGRSYRRKYTKKRLALHFILTRTSRTRCYTSWPSRLRTRTWKETWDPSRNWTGEAETVSRSPRSTAISSGWAVLWYTFGRFLVPARPQDNEKRLKTTKTKHARKPKGRQWFCVECAQIVAREIKFSLNRNQSILFVRDRRGSRRRSLCIETHLSVKSYLTQYQLL